MVVAHDDPAIRESAIAVVASLGCEVVGVAEGRSTRTLLRWGTAPEVLVTDVGLPLVLGYELCDDIAQLGLSTMVVFIASVYSRTAYKRRPSELYGAADYVEQHHIPDMLGPKVQRLLELARERRPATSLPLLLPHDDGGCTEEREIIREAGEARLSPDVRDGESGVERAQRIARLIVADVMLYCGDLVAAWVRSPTGAMPRDLARDLERARRLFQVPEEIARGRDFFAEALTDFIRSRRPDWAVAEQLLTRTGRPGREE